MAITRLGPNQSLNLANNVTGALPVANGGTGLTSGTTDQFLKFTGSTTLASAVDNAGLVLITEANISGTGAYDIDNLFSSTYRDYKVFGSGLKQATDNTQWVWQFRYGSTTVSTGYRWAGVGARNTGSAVDDGEENSTDYRIIGTAANDTHATSFEMTLYDPYGYQVSKNYTCLAGGRRSGDGGHDIFTGGYLPNDERMTGLRFNVDNGNMTAGNIKVYGIKGS